MNLNALTLFSSKQNSCPTAELLHQKKSIWKQKEKFSIAKKVCFEEVPAEPFELPQWIEQAVICNFQSYIAPSLCNTSPFPLLKQIPLCNKSYIHSAVRDHAYEDLKN